MAGSVKHSYNYQNPDCYERDIRYERAQKLTRRRVPKRKPKSKNPIAAFFAVCLLGLYSYYVCPYNFEHYFRPLILNRFLNGNLILDIEPRVNPANYYAYNSFLLDKYLLVPPVKKTKEFIDIKMTGELTSTKQKLKTLFAKYPHLEPSVFVWEYSTGKGLSINGDVPYPSASIIKIPIAFELIRLINDSAKTQNPINLTDKRTFTEFFRTSGSGYLQKTRADVDYTIDYLANIMIADSDNSATNMLLYEIGGVDGFNRDMRNIGLKMTSMRNWLPDLEGTNKTTAHEISELLYNIDNPKYINPKYKSVLKEYLGSTRNTHLLKEKLPAEALILHKTGNIGTMLGDAGIVYTNSGKKYIVAMLVKRPHNDLSARTLIQDASLLIYNDINNQ